MVLYFITTNKNKFEEAKKILDGVELKMLPLKVKEIQSEDVEKVIEAKIEDAKKLKKPFVVEDSGLYIKALNGFPGALTSWAMKSLGNQGILKLMKGIKDREAFAKCAVGFYSPNFGKKLLLGKVKGKIALKEKGSYGFGFDPIFIPTGYKKTFAELGEEIKNKISHRATAFKKLLKFSKFY